MISVVAASSLYHSLKTLNKKHRVTVDELLSSAAGLTLDPNTGNGIYDNLSTPSLESRHIVLWHDLLNNTITSHPRNNLPQTNEEHVSTIKTLQNNYCVVTCQRDGTPPVFNTLRFSNFSTAASSVPLNNLMKLRSANTHSYTNHLNLNFAHSGLCHNTTPASGESSKQED